MTQLTDEDRALVAEGLYDAFWARAQSKHPENRVEKTPFRNTAAAIQSMWSDIAEDAAALLSAARQASTLEPGEGWEPIETARRNGEEVLVWGRSIGRQIASAKSVPRHEPYEWPSGWDFPTGATHWRPLPAPPASQIKEG